MPKWLQIVVVIIVFFTVAGFYERWRVTALDAWRRARAFTRIEPFVPADHAPIPQIVSLITGRDDGLTRRYASANRGAVGDAMVTLVEFEYTPQGRKTSAWFTLAVWASGPMSATLKLYPRGTNALDEAVRMVKGTAGSAGVWGDPAAQKHWLTDQRRRALDEWEHGGQFVVIDGFTGWVTEGLLTPSRGDQLLAQVTEARRILN